MPDRPQTSATPREMETLIEAVRSLSGLEEPLRQLLTLEEAPAISDRVEAFVQELQEIRKQLDRAVSAMEQARSAEEILQKLDRRLEEQETLSRQIAENLQQMMVWFQAPPREAGRRS